MVDKKDSKRSKYMNVPIPRNLYGKIKKRLKKTEFNSVPEYVTYVLKEVISSLEEEDRENNEETVFTEEDEKKIKDRLRALGYLD